MKKRFVEGAERRKDARKKRHTDRLKVDASDEESLSVLSKSNQGLKPILQKKPTKQDHGLLEIPQ